MSVPGPDGISNFAVLKAMADANDDRLTLAPLSNIISARKVKAGTQVTIGVGGNIVGAIANGELVGGLILVRREAFDAVKAAIAAVEDLAVGK
jgi:hypothetical protein